MSLRIGVDLGGTKIEAVALDATGATRARRRQPTPRHDYDASVAAIAGLVRALEEEVGPATVGVGIPGSLSPRTGLVRNGNSVWLNGRPLAEDLGRALARSVRVANDANCFAVSEAVDGAAAGASVVAAVIIGTGVGSGIAIGGAVHNGFQGVAGEFGHVGLPFLADDEWPGRDCWCGRRGCIETFCSGPAFEADHARRAGLATPISAPEIMARAAMRDRLALESFGRYLDRLARALSVLIDVVDPDVIVLGGGLSNIDAIYAELPPLLDRHVFSDGCATPVRKAAHGDASGVRGAAWLWGR